MSVTAAQSAGHHDHGGQTYHFCSTSCFQRFRSNPDRFLSPEADLPPVRSEYTCPMHPEVVRPGPGPCPSCGMALEPKTPATVDAPDPEYVDMRRRFWVSLVLTLPLWILSMGFGADAWIQLLLASPVVLWGGFPFFQRGWASVLRRFPNMFTLISLGVLTSYLFSIFLLLFPGYLPKIGFYFEVGASIVLLVLLGQVLELRARRSTQDALRAFLRLSPKLAVLLDSYGNESEVLLKDIRPGNLLRIRPGENVPVDGSVLEGTASVDESMLTGESIPISKSPGDRLLGGTLLAGGSLVMRAEQVGEQTYLARLTRMVAEAQRSRAPIQATADRVSAFFVPAVLGVSLLTFLLWLFLGSPGIALVSAVSVLLIACPCALGLATPMSIAVAVGRGARSGILFREARALEVLSRVTTVVVDKTGTLTEGKPAVISIQTAGIEENEVLSIAASLEQGSEHPIGKAILQKARERALSFRPISEFRSFPGEGVSGILTGEPLLAGTETFLSQHAVALEGTLLAKARDARNNGQVVSFVARGGRSLGFIGLADPVKESAHAAVKLFRKRGISVVMATGDHEITARAVARALGIADVHSSVSPARKLKIVTDLQRRGEIVAVAGDGVNDAPALAKADVGIAMATGTDVAMASAGITLLKGDLTALVRAWELSRSTLHNIRQNLFFAFLYNALGIPVAAGALYPFTGILLSPMIAAAAMSFSSVSVIGNALRLRNRIPIGADLD